MHVSLRTNRQRRHRTLLAAAVAAAAAASPAGAAAAAVLNQNVCELHVHTVTQGFDLVHASDHCCRRHTLQ